MVNSVILLSSCRFKTPAILFNKNYSIHDYYRIYVNSLKSSQVNLQGNCELVGEGSKGAFKTHLALSLLLHSSEIHVPLTVLFFLFLYLLCG